MNGKTGNNQLVRISDWRRHEGGQVGREIQKNREEAESGISIQARFAKCDSWDKECDFELFERMSLGMEGRHPRDEFR